MILFFSRRVLFRGVGYKSLCISIRLYCLSAESQGPTLSKEDNLSFWQSFEQAYFIDLLFYVFILVPRVDIFSVIICCRFWTIFVLFLCCFLMLLLRHGWATFADETFQNRRSLYARIGGHGRIWRWDII